MSTKPNLRKFTVLAFSKSQASLEGVEPLAQLERLEGTQLNDDTSAEVRFQNHAVQQCWRV